MLYLDYSATTPVNKEVLDSFNKACLEYVGNANSLHKLGNDSANLIDEATKQIQSILKTDKEVIYTSGSSESNNTVIKGICSKYKNRGKHIITSPLEHSSIYEPLKYLEDNFGFEVSYVKIDEFGRVDLNDLRSLMRDDTILVTISSVNSELGIIEPVEEIGKIIKEYPKCYFHSDMTQSIGKIKINIDNIDFVSFTAHKFYGLKGIGVLLKNKNIIIEPLIHGGKSTTNYRSGTPALPLIVSLAKALRLISEDFSNRYNHVLELNEYLKKELAKFGNVVINSNEYSVPHILNISIIDVKPETMLHALEEYNIYISTQSACSSGKESKAVLALTKDNKKALSSIRISISYLTEKKDIDYFINSFEKCYNKLV